MSDCAHTGLHHRLDHLFTMRVLEDSFGHCELHDSIQRLSAERGAETVRACLGHVFLTMETPDVITYLTRVERMGTPEWRGRLVRDALRSGNIEMRDAAAQAAEHWPERGILAALEEHDEPKQWLADYINDVAADHRHLLAGDA